jgi:outer membrane protein insertion porin family
MVITDSAVRRDYERLNNLGFFEKVELNPKPGPDPKRPGLVTLDWSVKEQRTGTATLGAGYSGGLTGTGLTGTLSYQENNINGTGNGGAIRLERGSRVGDAQLSFTIPYLGNTPKSQRYSLGGTIFTSAQTNYYPVYLDCGQSGLVACPTNGAAQPVAIVPPNPTNYQLVSGVVSTYKSRSTGVGLTLGRRLTDIFKASVGANVQQVAAQATVPSGYFFPTTQTAVSSPISNGVTGFDTNSPSAALGIVAPSIAQINSTKPYNLRSLVFGLAADSRDDIFNPRRGVNAAISDEVSGKALSSDFNYQIITLDAAKFFPVMKNATFGVHGLSGFSTGAIPTNKLFIFSDQQLRGYANPFYGTDELLAQAELRIPFTSDRKFSIVTFVESGAMRIRGGRGIDASGNATIDLSRFTWHSDVGVGLRFDVPQLGLHTLRLDFAKGSQGTHTSFGIGQSF